MGRGLGNTGNKAGREGGGGEGKEEGRVAGGVWWW